MSSFQKKSLIKIMALIGMCYCVRPVNRSEVGSDDAAENRPPYACATYMPFFGMKPFLSDIQELEILLVKRPNETRTKRIDEIIRQYSEADSLEWLIVNIKDFYFRNAVDPLLRRVNLNPYLRKKLVEKIECSFPLNLHLLILAKEPLEESDQDENAYNRWIVNLLYLLPYIKFDPHIIAGLKNGRLFEMQLWPWDRASALKAAFLAYGGQIIVKVNLPADVSSTPWSTYADLLNRLSDGDPEKRYPLYLS